MARQDLGSPPRGHGSSRRSSPQRERSPTRHRSSRTTSTSATEKISARNRSPKHANPRSRSPEPRSPPREKFSSRKKSSLVSNKSPKRARSRSPVSRSPAREKVSSRKMSPQRSNRSPKRARSRSPESPLPSREKPTSRKKSPQRRKSISPSTSPVRERPLNRSPRRADAMSTENGSPSPRTKRLRRAQAEKEAEKASERDRERNHSRRGDNASHRERDSQKEVFNERRDRRSGRDVVDNEYSRSRRDRSRSPNNHRSRNRSRSPPAADRIARDEVANSMHSYHQNGDDDSISKMKAAEAALESKEKQKPSFELSGKLAAETNRVKGVTLLFTEPPEAKKPDIRWRLYVLKGGEVLNEPLYVHRQSCYLFGRERRVADIPTDHPSCSKQHAVLQYRQIVKENSDGTSSKVIRPYMMDLGSTNGTFINDDRIEPQRYYELMEKDTLKFGNSSREYVLLHENSAG